MAKAKQPDLIDAPEVSNHELALQWESVQDPITGAFSQRLVSMSNSYRQQLNNAGLTGAAQGAALKQQLLDELSAEELEELLAERKAKAEAAAEDAKKASEGSS